LSANFVVIIVIGASILAILMVPRLLTGRAIRSVVRIFRQNGAVTVNNAKSVDELGLKPLTLAERLLRTRDYKPYALRLLIDAGIVKADERGHLYLSEEELAESKWNT
jgi:hypothetical protein